MCIKKDLRCFDSRHPHLFVCVCACVDIKEYLRGFVSRHPDHFAWHEPEGGTFAFVKLLHLSSGATAASYARELMDKGIFFKTKTKSTL